MGGFDANSNSESSSTSESESSSNTTLESEAEADVGTETGAGAVDPEDALDWLIETGVVHESADGSLSATSEFEETRGIYYDSYVDVPDESFHRTVADVFGVSREEAAAYVTRNDVRREDLVDFLSLRSFLDDLPAVGTLALMARIVGEVGPDTPVPDPIKVITDETYDSYLGENPDALVTVWRHYCQPCEEMKDDLDALLARVPDDVAVAGLDGEASPQFRLAYGVDAAPAVCLFRDSELRAHSTGRTTPAELERLVEDVYRDGDGDRTRAEDDTGARVDLGSDPASDVDDADR